jgi:putative membrane protein
MKLPHEYMMLLVLLILALLLSAINPYDALTWWLETFPVLLGLPVVLLTAKKFPLTPLSYRLLFIHAVILIVGAHYTYARVPLGFWTQDLFDLSRNQVDRLGHLAQGFIPAILAREILIRRSALQAGKWLFFLVLCVCLAISAFYELIEWWVAIAAQQGAVEFLGTQGDIWDTQSDMMMALIGAVLAQLLLTRGHDRALKHLTGVKAS